MKTRNTVLRKRHAARGKVRGFLSTLEHVGSGVVHTAESGWHDVTHAVKDVGNTTREAWHGAIHAAKTTAHSLADPNSLTSRIGHTVLDGARMVPIVGTVSEGINAAWYGAQGDAADAAMAAAGRGRRRHCP